MSCLLDQILGEMDKLDREKTAQDAASRLCYLISNSTPKEIAQEVANAAAFYAIFDNMLDKLTTLQKITEAIDLLDLATREVKNVPNPKDIN